MWEKVFPTALAIVAQWTECWPASQRVAGLIPNQGTCDRQPHIAVSLPLFLPPLPTL